MSHGGGWRRGDGVNGSKVSERANKADEVGHGKKRKIWFGEEL